MFLDVAGRENATRWRCQFGERSRGRFGKIPEVLSDAVAIALSDADLLLHFVDVAEPIKVNVMLCYVIRVHMKCQVED